ncbi:unnamed protein product [Prorocentrum cordatum]|uniref:Amino acid transporter transmembrane domain-containing protein n=1 Tax=Prorocentrum cordatum TaxID=2364126 RepID=A0ABN9U9L8_9DINO|nr:unnamed protein product [Polarella glacialis]
MVSIPLWAATICFACYSMETLSCFNGVPPQLCNPVPTRYFGRLVFLTVQTNILNTMYFACCIITAVLDIPHLEKVVVEAFPLSFGLGVFLTIGYYALDHFNPIAVQTRKKWSEEGYPHIVWRCHTDHIFALPSSILAALVFTTPQGATASNWKAITLSYGLLYTVLLHINALLTGAWPYAIIEDIMKKSGSLGRTMFLAVIISLILMFATLGHWIAG